MAVAWGVYRWFVERTIAWLHSFGVGYASRLGPRDPGTSKTPSSSWPVALICLEVCGRYMNLIFPRRSKHLFGGLGDDFALPLQWLFF